MDPADVELRPYEPYVLPDELRSELQGDYGPIVQTHQLASALDGATAIAAVGDVVSMTLREIEIEPDVIVCDYHTQRRIPEDTFRNGLGDWGTPFPVVNPAGMLNGEAWDACLWALACDGVGRVEVTGEEDLLALPLFLALPDEARLIYGVPGRGAAVVTINEALRDRVRAILRGMATSTHPPSA